MVTTLRDLQATLLEIAIGIGKWMLASLLAVNGAAAVATWQTNMEIFYKLMACGAFIAGLIAALVCGASQIRQIIKVTKPLGEAIGYWVSVQADGLRSAELEDLGPIAASNKTFWIWAFGIISVVLFLSGVALAGYGGAKQVSISTAGKSSPPVAPHPNQHASSLTRETKSGRRP
jgi:hypothetical protein